MQNYFLSFKVNMLEARMLTISMKQAKQGKLLGVAEQLDKFLFEFFSVVLNFSLSF